MPLLSRALPIVAFLVACGDEPEGDGESTGTTTTAADTTTESTTGPTFDDCQPALIDDIGLELTILPPFTPEDDMGVRYSGACEVSELDLSEPTLAVIDLACSGEGGPQADWSATARVTWTGGTLPLQLAPGSAVDLTLEHSAAAPQLDSIAIHVEDELMLAVSSGQALALPAGGDPVWAPLQVEAPPDQMCADASDECAARNLLLFDGLTDAVIDVFDHHAVATGSYDILVGRALTPLETPCDVAHPAWYDFIVLRTGG